MSTPARTPSRLERTAYHEAGHAVAGHLEGRPVRYVTIQPTEQTLGECCFYRWRPHIRPDRGVDAKTELRLRSLMIIGLAGHAVDWIWTGRHHWAESAWDLDRVGRLGLLVVGSEKELKAYLKWLWIRTVTLVNTPQHKAAIEAVALALLAEKTLRSRQVKAIANEALVSGAPAATDEA